MIPAFLFPFFLFLTIQSIISANADTRPKLQTYIIQLRLPLNATFFGRDDLERWYESFLPNITTVAGAKSRMVHKYGDAIVGFAAKLTEAEVKDMSKKEGFLKAYPEKTLNLLTTHTPTFLGLDRGKGFWNVTAGFGKGVIVGVLDSGIMGRHPSFGDEGMPPPPSKWKGRCNFEDKKHCNNKIIGAIAFQGGPFDGKPLPPDDDNGHGSHTASTAAGNFVIDAAVLGNGNGTVTGMAPRAHLAIYKVCGNNCLRSSVLAGIDTAIKDSVDVISMSIGSDESEEEPYNEDIIAIGSFAAAEKGIFVSVAAGNGGPGAKTLSNEAPWYLTVGASNRSVTTTVKLGDGQEIDGQSVFQPRNFTSKMLPMVYFGNDYSDRYPDSSNCVPEIFDDINVAGKIVICEVGKASTVTLGELVKNSGGEAVILVNRKEDGDTVGS